VRLPGEPHYEPQLRELTGLDPRVIEYIGLDGRLEELYVRLGALLDYPAAAVCPRGQGTPRDRDRMHGRPHRSVAIAEHWPSATRGDG